MKNKTELETGEMRTNFMDKTLHVLRSITYAGHGNCIDYGVYHFVPGELWPQEPSSIATSRGDLLDLADDLARSHMGDQGYVRLNLSYEIPQGAANTFVHCGEITEFQEMKSRQIRQFKRRLAKKLSIWGAK